MLAVLILTNFHRLASVAESLGVGIIDSKNINNKDHDQTQLDTIIKIEEIAKGQIIKELENINLTLEKKAAHKRTSSDGTNIQFVSLSFDRHPGKEYFSRHISDYCTKYLDFDSHSQEFGSYIVT